RGRLPDHACDRAARSELAAARIAPAHGGAIARDTISAPRSGWVRMKPLPVIGCVALAALSPLAGAQAPGKTASSYPAKPIRIIVPFAPGGGLDITTRLIGRGLSEKWGANIVVDNRPGAA